MSRVKKRKIIHQDENGHIVVETIGTFIPFVFLVVSILSLVSIVALQARVHYALTQAANTMSMYSYLLEVLGIANSLTTLDNKAYKVTSEVGAIKSDVNSVLSGLGSLSDLSGAAESGRSVIDRVYGYGEAAVGDPEAAFQIIMNYGVNELRNQVFAEIIRPLVGRYLANGDLTGDEYLTSMGVVNKHTGKAGLEALDFASLRNIGRLDTTVIDKDGNVRLVVEYEVMYTFGGLPLPFNPTLRITQTAVTKAWLNGSGKGYW